MTRTPPVPTFPGHKRKCLYPREHCVCGALKYEDSEAYRRRRAKDLDALGRHRLAVFQDGEKIPVPGKGSVEGKEAPYRRELKNERRRAVRQFRREEGNLSPRQLKKRKREFKRELKELEEQQRAMQQAIAAAKVDQVDVPAGMRRTASGLVVPA